MGDEGHTRRDGDLDVLALTREELQATFEYQVERLREIDNKAIEILKANLLLIGIVVTGGSVLVQTEIETGVFLNAFTVTGGFLLLVSTGLASVTYTSSNLRGGLGTDAVEAAIEADAGDRPDASASDGTASTSNSGGRSARERDPTFERRLLRSYARWIGYNARMIAVNDILVTVTVLLVFVAFVYVVAGVIVAAIGPSSVATAAGYLVMTAAMGAFIRLAYHMDHIGSEPDPRSETFRGIRLSKGTSRRQGLTTLREMIGRSPPDHVESE